MESTVPYTAADELHRWQSMPPPKPNPTRCARCDALRLELELERMMHQDAEHRVAGLMRMIEEIPGMLEKMQEAREK